MKKLLVIFFLGVGALAHSQEKQSLKDLLYGGKLKKDSSGVIRKTDDLASKIDTSTKKEAEPEKPNAPLTVQDATAMDTMKTVQTSSAASNEAANNEVSDIVPPPPPPPPAATKTNTKLWKEYTDSLTSYFKSEVLSSKQIKKDTYYMSLDYEIGTDGTVTVNNLASTPTNNFLLAQVKQYLDTNPPKLNPVLDSNGQPKKTKRKQSLTITKD